MKNVSKYILTVSLIFAASCGEYTGNDISSTNSNTSVKGYELNQSSNITAGYVRGLIYNNLFNTLGATPCFDGRKINFKTISGEKAFKMLAESFGLNQGGQVSSTAQAYLNGLQANPNITMAVLITIPGSNQTYIYIPNSGEFDLSLIIDPNDQTDAGLLIRIVGNSSGQSVTTRVSCETCNGSYGTNCSCTCRTITVVCTDNEPCICNGGDQCAGSCNLQPSWNVVCANTEPFYDNSWFYGLPPETSF